MRYECVNNDSTSSLILNFRMIVMLVLPLNMKTFTIRNMSRLDNYSY